MTTKRIEYWVNINKSGADFCGSKEEAEETKEPDDSTYRLTERRDGETVVGPLEMAVIEAAMAQYEETLHAMPGDDDTTEAYDRACAATNNAVRAMKELEKSQ